MEQSAITTVRRVLSQNPKKTLLGPSLTPSGVMLLLYPVAGEYCVLLNVRSDSVEDHRGEISFPGGRKDESDRTLLDTALRETHEEMGVRPQDVEVLGELDDVATNSSYLISPFVGTIQHPYRFRPNDREVVEVLEVPLAELSDDGSVRDEVWLEVGGLVSRPSYAYKGHLIYGATARILSRFLELLNSVPEEEAVWKTKQP
jgi:8-oxo-dGTP pyrophosphatase MutT (NUDIX family)